MSKANTATRIFFSALSLVVSSSAYAYELSQGELIQQAQQPFEKKFSIVTTNLKETSKQNLAGIEAALKTQPGFVTDLKTAQAQMPALMSELAISHAESVKGALRSLESGAVKSLDEVVREGKVRPEAKQSAHSYARTDGVIGEQDVVYFAIRDKLNLDSSRFGEISFIFDESIVDQGYFTPYAFTAGLWPAHTGGETKTASENLKYNQGMVDFYRPFVFSGKADLQKFLLYSVLQNIRFERDLAPAFRRDFEPFQDQFYVNDHLAECASLTNQLVAQLGQRDHAADDVCEGQAQEILNFVNGNGYAEYGNLFKIFNAYRGFPMSLNSRSPLLTTASFEFIELKIPRQVSLSLMTKILAVKSDELPRAQLESAIKAYAQKSGRTFTTCEKDYSIEYRFVGDTDCSK